MSFYTQESDVLASSSSSSSSHEFFFQLQKLERGIWQDYLSRWLDELDKDVNPKDPKIQIDVEWGGGGFAGYYDVAPIFYFQNSKRFEIVNHFAVSAGSFAAVASTSQKFHCPTYIEYYQTIFQRNFLQQVKPLAGITQIKDLLMEKDFYKNVQDNLYITAIDITEKEPKPIILNGFTSDEDLFQAMCASSCVPGVTIDQDCVPYRGYRLVDGIRVAYPHSASNLSMGNKHHLFFSHQARPLLVFSPGPRRESYSYSWTPQDPNLADLIRFGMRDFEYILRGFRKPQMLKHLNFQIRELSHMKKPPPIEHLPLFHGTLLSSSDFDPKLLTSLSHVTAANWDEKERFQDPDFQVSSEFSFVGQDDSSCYVTTIPQRLRTLDQQKKTKVIVTAKSYVLKAFSVANQFKTRWKELTQHKHKQPKN